ncbi:tripartite tricarboxylate transporter TctB family protein [Dethiosulfovibrio sp. F2B]|uniref:tripartite tricarboxylate transporter TctB family protein n=1 Tax=Dethiosulfovibrio faecalis TaxID=2720018 RepID=UPI001F3DB79E|nr:tripartite tricarboxylate transporter TctB family protein [Dethiosulfovibrio faecalis]MCF4151657.1 tripartite tricarboxylate transporter TctB family protein [Dethiosulfovibrio faecalis]
MTKNMISGLLSVVLGLAYIYGATLIPEVKAGDEIGPRLFPYIIGISAVICGGLLTLAELRKKEREPFSFGFVTERPIWIKIFAIIVLGIFYGETLDYLGYVIGTILFMVLVGSILNKGRLVQNAIIAVSFSCVCYGVFSIALKLSLPRGLLSFLPF